MKHILHSVSIMNRAGQESLIMNIYRNIDRNKIQFDFQCYLDGVGDFDEEIKSLGGAIYYIGDNKYNGRVSKYIGAVRLQSAFFKKHPEFETLHFHTSHSFDAFLAALGAKIGGAKNIIIHSHNSFGVHPWLNYVFRFFMKFMKIERVACSEAAWYWLFGKSRKFKIKIIKNGIVPEEYALNEEARNSVRKELNLEDAFIVGHVGRFDPQKNHRFLLEIFAKVSQANANAYLVLVGTGALQDDIKNQVKSLNIADKVLFLGVRKDIPALLSAMDLLVFPSLHEGLSVVLVEAQAAGLPIITSDRVSPETKLTEDLEFIKLESSASIWAEKVLSKENYVRKNRSKDIKKQGYDIRMTADDIMKFYLSL